MRDRDLFDTRRLAELADEARSLLDLLATGRRPDKEHPQAVLPAQEILERARDARPDGYPRRSMGGGCGTRSTSGLAELVTQDWIEHAECEGEGCRKCSDGFVYHPAERARSAAVEVVNRVASAVAELRQASAALHKASSNEGDPKPAPADEELWCTNHLKHRMFEPRAEKRNHLCRWCYEFRLANRADAPKQLLELRAQGKRITGRSIDQALGRRQGRRTT